MIEWLRKLRNALRLRRKPVKVEATKKVAKRNYRKEYDNYHARPEQKKRRALRNKARRKAVKEGRVRKGDGMDIDHTTGNPASKKTRVVSKSTNRSFPRNKNAGKKRKAS